MGFDRQKVEMAILMHENNGDNFDIFGRTFLEHKIGNLPYESSVRQRQARDMPPAIQAIAIIKCWFYRGNLQYL